MPSAYASASVKPRQRVTLSPWPTMMDDRIGTIGNTQGVSDSSRPATKNSGTINASRPPRSAEASWLSSAAAACATLAGAAGMGGSRVAALDDGGGIAAATGALLPPRTALRSGSACPPGATLMPPGAGAVTGATTPVGAASSALGITLAESASAPKAFSVTATVRGCGG